MMPQKIIISILAAFLFNGCDSSIDQNTTKAYHVGILAGVNAFDATIEGFQSHLSDFGYQEGENIRYSISRANGDKKAIKTAAEAFVENEVDLIFTITNGAALAAKNATVKSKIPVIFAIALAPIESGIVDSLTNPTGNVTGVRNPLAEFIGKRLEILKQISPSIKRVLVLNDPSYPTIPIAKKGLAIAAQLLDIELIDIPINSSKDIIDYYATHQTPKFEAIIVMPDLIVQKRENQMVTFEYATKHKLPIVANTPKQVENGALFSYHSDSYQSGYEAARLANRVLGKINSFKPPITNSEPQLVINLATAKILGLTVDDGLIALADRIIVEK